nr:hypothetical protein [Streptomyces sp. NRRL S-31]
MPWRRFLVLNALGATLWAGLWATLAYVAGIHVTALYDEVTRCQLYALIALGALVAALALRHGSGALLEPPARLGGLRRAEHIAGRQVTVPALSPRTPFSFGRPAVVSPTVVHSGIGCLNTS